MPADSPEPEALLRWEAFAEQARDIASVGIRKLSTPGRGEVAILATVDRRGRPRLAPVCPIFAVGGIFVLAGADTPKVLDLRNHGGFALHALVGADDEEFQIGGHALEVRSRARAPVLAAIPFPAFDPDDPVFELLIDRALAVTWPRPGEPRKRAWHVA